MEQLGALLGTLKTSVDELGGTLETAFSKDLKVDSGSVTLFDTPVKVAASASAKAEVFGKKQLPESPFPGTTLPPVTDAQRYIALQVGGQISANGEIKATPGVLAISATASAKTGFSYGHIRPFAADSLRLKAFGELIRTSRLPQNADLTALAMGEVLDFGATLNIDFGLKLKYGGAADINGVIRILEGLGGNALSMPFKAHIDFSASAAFGFSLYEAMHLTVGKISAERPEMVRVRMERQHKRSITFGVAMDLTVDYDATAGPLALLDKVFALVPHSEAVDALQELVALPEDWEKFKAAITDKAAAIVGRLVNDTGWKQAVAKSDAIAKLVETATKIVDAYKKLDDKVTSIVEKVLARLDEAGLNKLRPIIDQIAVINPKTLEITSLLSNEAQDVVKWIEVLTGQDIEELLVTGTARKELAKAVDAAKRLKELLDDGADSVLSRIHGLLDKSGATGFVAWLQKHATSVEDLQALGEEAVGDITRKLVGKALDSISKDDIKKIQTIAAKLDKFLKAPQALHDKLKIGIGKLKGTVGFSFALELSRVSESSALVDVELDSKNIPAMKTATELLSGHIESFLANLDQIKVKKGQRAPYAIREVLLTSRRVRTSAVTTLFSLLHFSLNEKEIAIDENSVAVKETSAGLVREALYSGGTVVRRKEGSTNSEASAWIRTAATGEGSDLARPYADATPVIRLSYVREDTSTDKESILSLRQLLGELSFVNAAARMSPDLVGKQTRFSLELEMGADAVSALQKEKTESGWNGDVLHTAHRWFDDVDRISSNDLKDGHEMAFVVRNKRFQELWTDVLVSTPSDTFFKASRKGEFGIDLFKFDKKEFKMEYHPLTNLMVLRDEIFKNFAAFDSANAVSHEPSVLVTAARQASTLFRTGQIGWQPPLFNFWFVLARLLRLDPSVFQSSRAVATFRSRVTEADDWSNPQIFALLEGISADNLRLS
jgi:hypothetical protein